MKDVTRQFKTWMIIKLGTGLKTANDFVRAFKRSRVWFTNNDIVNSIICKSAFKVASRKVKIKLVKISVKELGFIEGANLKQIYAKAQELGLKFCPPEVSPQLRLQYKDQPDNEENLVIIVKLIPGYGDNIEIFHLFRHADRLCFLHDLSYVSTNCVWHGDYQFVFCK
jgi:hypothetical protein